MTAAHLIPPAQHANPALHIALPELSTQRLVLRAPHLGDFPMLVAIDQDLATISKREGAGTDDESWCDFARGTAASPALVSDITNYNTASQNVTRKLGATRDAAAEEAIGEDHVQVWRHWGEIAQ